jgi:phenylalanyl-tRNA synthetase beta chain
LRKFDIRQPVFFADIYWDNLLKEVSENRIIFAELPRQNPVNRDLALIVEKTLPFETIEKAVYGIGLEKLRGVQLFDIFESEKLGIDAMINRIMKTAEEKLNAEIRK